MDSLTTFEDLHIGDRFKLCRSRYGYDFVGYTFMKCRNVKGIFQPDDPELLVKNPDYAVNLTTGFIVYVRGEERVLHETVSATV